MGDIPLIYRQLAERYKGVTAYDIADAQLKASGHPGLEKPPIEQEIDKASPEVQQLLRFKPSANRTRRAFTEPSRIDSAPQNMHQSLQSFPTDVRDSVEGAQLIVAAGVPPRGAAWLSGNIQQESGWYGQRVWGEVLGDGSDRNGGLVSWMDGVAHNNFRLRRIEKHLGKSITQASDAEQVQAMLWEMKTYYKSSYAAFMNPNSTDGDLIRASKRFWGYGEEGSRYQYARNIESKI